MLRDRVKRLERRHGANTCPCGATTVTDTMRMVVTGDGCQGELRCRECGGLAPRIPAAVLQEIAAKVGQQ